MPEADWADARWREVPAAAVDQFVWDEGGFKPVTRAKLQYSYNYLYVIFRVEDVTHGLQILEQHNLNTVSRF